MGDQRDPSTTQRPRVPLLVSHLPLVIKHHRLDPGRGAACPDPGSGCPFALGPREIQTTSRTQTKIWPLTQALFLTWKTKPSLRVGSDLVMGVARWLLKRLPGGETEAGATLHGPQWRTPLSGVHAQGGSLMWEPCSDLEAPVRGEDVAGTLLLSALELVRFSPLHFSTLRAAHPGFCQGRFCSSLLFQDSIS